MNNVRIFLLAAGVLIADSLNASTAFLTGEDFLMKARQFAAKNGSQVITSEQNSGCNKITVVPNDEGIPFAVLKGNRLAENFIYEYAEGVGLSDVVAPSYYINSLDIKDQTTKYSGTIEVFIPVIGYHSDSKALPQDMLDFIDKYKDSQGALTLMRFARYCKADDDRQFLYKKLNKENLDKVFVLYILGHLFDMTCRNALITVNAQQQFEFRIIDTLGCFASYPPSDLTFVLGFPHADEPLTESVRSLIPHIITKMPSFKGGIKCTVRKRLKDTEDCGGYGQQHKRMQALQDFLNNFPYASPRAIMVFAFWNTFFTGYYGDKVNLAVPILKALGNSYGSITLEKQKVAFDRVVWSLFYGYNHIYEGIAAYHKSRAQKPASFTNMLKFLTLYEYDEPKKNKSITDLLALIDPYLLEVKDYQLGTDGGSVPFILKKGFSRPEDTRIWTDRKKATILVPVNQEEGRVKSITFKDTEALISGDLKQVLFVFLNGKLLGEYRYTNASPSHMIEIPFPPSLTGTAKISLVMPFACKPKKVSPGNDDPRKLAIMLKSAEVMFYKLHTPTQSLLLNAIGMERYRLAQQGEGTFFPFPLEGFFQPEDHHIWSGKRASMRVPVIQEKGRVKTIILKDTGAFITDGHDQTAQVSLNGDSIGTYQYKRIGAHSHTIEIPVPTHLTGNAEITFDMADAHQPEGDSRELGIRLNLVDLLLYQISN